MSVTILEVLQNAKINLIDNGDIMLARAMGTEQLKNAVTLLEKGYSVDDVFDSIIDKHGTVEDAPSVGS